jgi:hypothetical protein
MMCSVMWHKFAAFDNVDVSLERLLFCSYLSHSCRLHEIFLLADILLC